MATLPQKEPRNQVAEGLRRVEADETMTITVAGRPVAELGPTRHSPWVSGDELARLWRGPIPRGLDHDLLTLGADLIDPFEA